MKSNNYSPNVDYHYLIMKATNWDTIFDLLIKRQQKIKDCGLDGKVRKNSDIMLDKLRQNLNEMSNEEFFSKLGINLKGLKEKQSTMNIRRYVKKPVVIEAMQFTRHTWYELIDFTHEQVCCFMKRRPDEDVYTCIVSTLEGPMTATEGDYIIKGIQGEFYPCKPDIFEETYEKVTN